MPSKKKAASELPTIPKDLIDQLVTGPMTPEAVQDVSGSLCVRHNMTTEEHACQARNRVARSRRTRWQLKAPDQCVG